MPPTVNQESLLSSRQNFIQNERRLIQVQASQIYGSEADSTIPMFYDMDANHIYEKNLANIYMFHNHLVSPNKCNYLLQKLLR